MAFLCVCWRRDLHLVCLVPFLVDLACFCVCCWLTQVFRHSVADTSPGLLPGIELLVLILCVTLRDQRNQASVSQKEETLFFLEDSWVGATF